MDESEHRNLGGERGPKGDHGQAGSRGLRGSPAPPVLSWLVALLLIALIFTATGVLTYKMVQATGAAKGAAAKAKEQAVTACEQANKNSRAVNASLDLQAALDPAHAGDYTALKVSVVDC